MKPYKHIHEAKKVLKTLVNEAKTMDNTRTRLTELNVLISTINSFEEMLNKKYFTEYFDVLLLSRMYQFFLDNKVYETNDVPISPFLYWLNQDLDNGRDNIKKDIIGLVQGCQLSESLKRGKAEFEDYEVWDKVIEDTLNNVKTNVKWIKK